MSDDDRVYVFVGTYSGTEDAEADSDGVKWLHSDGVIGTYDAAVVDKDDEGNVHVHVHEKPTRFGAWTGLVVGPFGGHPLPPEHARGGSSGRRDRRGGRRRGGRPDRPPVAGDVVLRHERARGGPRRGGGRARGRRYGQARREAAGGTQTGREDLREAYRRCGNAQGTRQGHRRGQGPRRVSYGRGWSPCGDHPLRRPGSHLWPRVRLPREGGRKVRRQPREGHR